MMNLSTEFNANLGIQTEILNFVTNCKEFFKQMHYCRIVKQDIEIL